MQQPAKGLSGDKRVPHSSPGIVFYGLSRVEKYANRDELEKIVDFFFREQGLDVKKEGMRVDIHFLPPHTLCLHDENGNSGPLHTWGMMQPSYNDSYFKISICRTVSRKIFNFGKDILMLKTLAHELDHVLWAYQYDGLFDDLAHYGEQLHEVRAHRQSGDWAMRLRKQLIESR